MDTISKSFMVLNLPVLHSVQISIELKTWFHCSIKSF